MLQGINVSICEPVIICILEPWREMVLQIPILGHLTYLWVICGLSTHPLLVILYLCDVPGPSFSFSN